MPRIGVFVGTRPEIIKLAPVIRDLNKRTDDIAVIHTGQHYDWEMSEQFFKELNIAEPNQFLGVGSGAQGLQLSKVISSAEACLVKRKIKLAVVEGDTNSALGVALAAAKNNVQLAHVEAGCRSFDKTMPEEMNRILIADCADINLAPTENCVQNLRNEGIPQRKVTLTGHPLVTLIKNVREKIRMSTVNQSLALKKRGYVIATAHRKENVDDPRRLRSILKSLSDLPTTVVFPIHPRTRDNIKKFKLSTLLKPIHSTPPLGYLDTLRLIEDAEAVITDSGGIQQEAFLLKTPCLTIRKTTEWIETIQGGGNFLVENLSEIDTLFKEVRQDRTRIVKKIVKAGDVFGDYKSASHISDALFS
jgi:UDP-N-acetylglucosamine 2-epimerase